MTEGDRITKIAVVGGGIVALSAALVFARALPRVKVELVRTPMDPSSLADRMPAAWPSIHRFHAAAGIDERSLVARGVATHRLGTGFKNWSASGRDWYHVFGDYGPAAGPVPFHMLWAKASRSFDIPSYHSFAMAAVLAEVDRFVHPSADKSSPLSSFEYGLFLDVEGYAGLLLEAVQAARVSVAAGAIAGIELDADGRIRRLQLQPGRSIEADIFLDCAGPSAPLHTAVGGELENWSGSHPVDRLFLASSPASSPLSPRDMVTPFGEGWRWTVRTPGRRFEAVCYASDFVTDEEALAGGDIEHVEALALVPGRRREPWIRNVLAIGDAALAVDPLHATGLYAAHNAILLALELLPGPDCHPVELREYNRRAGQEAIRIRDFLALQYLRAGRSGDRFWEAAAEGEMPPSLARTLEQFEHRGRLPVYEGEPFSPQSWRAVLLGLGVIPANVDPSVGAADAARTARAMESVRAQLAKIADELPPYADYIRRLGSRDIHGRRALA